MITPIKPKSTLDCAIDAIRAYILDNRLQPGDVLPTETVLAQKLGISRNILREAMRHYRTLGIIDSKPKLGAAIARLVPDNPYAGYLPFFAAGGNSLRELFEIRSSLEAGAAPFLVRSVTPEGLALLRKIHRQMELDLLITLVHTPKQETRAIQTFNKTILILQVSGIFPATGS